jgi:hypothetical protein
MFHSVVRSLRRVCGVGVLLCALGAAQAQGVAKMALLVPDGLALTHVQVTAWSDAAQEQGYQLAVLRNAELLRLGVGVRAQYAGLIIADQMHTRMSDALVSTVESYVAQGGQIMLVFDAGALTAAGFYAVPKSRFSNLVGVDYVLYDALRDRTVGLGPVLGTVPALRALQVPPGKSMLYTSPVLATAARVAGPTTSDAAPASASAQFLPSGPANVGGLAGYDHAQFFQSLGRDAVTGTTSPEPGKGHKKLLREGTSLVQRGAVQGPQVEAVAPDARVATTAAAPLAAALVAEPLHSISGYAYGALTYPSFVTQGAAQGSVLLSSPQHGVVASSRTVGSGKVLFVNMPLTYLKLYEDAMPLHGFMHYFARDMLKQPRLAAVPGGVGGMVFNWHLDSQAALQPMQQLKNLGVWNYKPFSMHMTAGPDTIAFGDRLGFDLPNNAAAQKFLRDFDRQGHEVASHGGWIHDYYGFNVNETNANQFLNYLVLNRNAVQAVVPGVLTEYSAPLGNNPVWALNWLAQNGVGSYYSLSHTGTAATRSYRQGALASPMWAFPVTPFGLAATFEDFQELGIPESEILQWYRELVDFSANSQTNRLIYAHPPGAANYPNVMLAMLQYAQLKQTAGLFRWYTMTQLSTFMNSRAAVTWQSGLAANGRMRVTASHPTNLATMSWVYPKGQYAQPVVMSGAVSVLDRGQDWLVRVNSGRAAVFEAAPLL